MEILLISASIIDLIIKDTLKKLLKKIEFEGLLEKTKFTIIQITNDAGKTKMIKSLNFETILCQENVMDLNLISFSQTLIITLTN